MTLRQRFRSAEVDSLFNQNVAEGVNYCFLFGNRLTSQLSGVERHRPVAILKSSVPVTDRTGGLRRMVGEAVGATGESPWFR